MMKPAVTTNIARQLFLLGVFLLAVPGLFGANGRVKAAKANKAIPASDLELLPGFKAELLHVAETNQGSWICLAVDSRGRLIISPQSVDQPMLRVTLTSAGQMDRIESISVPLREAMGLCYAHDSLYVNGKGPDGPGLYRLVDGNRNDQFETNEVRLLKKFTGKGEHGYHAVVAGADGMIYVMNGNHTKVPDDIATNSPHKNFQEDFLLPRLWDANGHAVGILAPGGYILRTNPEGKQWELLLGGFRNSYDFDFNTDGEMFTFDSDMEWDWGLPWYRPTRINHCVLSGESGWRSGSGNWPDYYADSLPATINIGLGSPTGVKFGTKSNYPQQYKDALFAMDWSYGRIFAVHLKPDGASYTADSEVFLKGKPLNLTDLEFGKDGAMYFITGGRGTQSGLYRVSYDKKLGDKTASAPAAKAAPTRSEIKSAAKARELRHKLESYHGKKDADAIVFAWPYLASDDIYLRYAARIAIEWQDVALWQQRALSETNTRAGLTALLALARCGGRETQADLLRALERFPFTRLTELQQLEKLRVLQLSFIRQGRPVAGLVRMTLEQLNPLYPAPTDNLNRELLPLLVYLKSPEVITKTLALLDVATTQEQQAHYIYNLRNVQSGWTLEQRKKYFAWFAQAKHPGKPDVTSPNGKPYMVWTNQAQASRAHPPELVQWFKDVGRDYGDGSSYANYLTRIRKDAIATLNTEERIAMGALLDESLGGPAWKQAMSRKFVKEWTVNDLAPALGEVARGRDFKNGRAAFNDAACILCHRFGNEGGSAGQELTGAASKYSLRDILESMIEPSKVVSDQFQNFDIFMKDGDDITGRITDENEKRLVLLPSMLAPEVTMTVPISEIARREPSKTSPMPIGLLNQLTQDDILDLLAYLQSMGNARAGNFSE